jgi:hypothetical protein
MTANKKNFNNKRKFGSTSKKPATGGGKYKKNQNCFNCGETGHWSKNCPKSVPATGLAKTAVKIAPKPKTERKFHARQLKRASKGKEPADYSTDGSDSGSDMSL